MYNRLLLRKKTMINFIEINRDNPFICSNIIKHWIESNYKKSNIMTIIRREKGFITNETIRYIWESGFVSSHEAELKNSLNGTSLILDYFSDYIAFFTKSFYKFNFQFYTSFAKMMRCVYLSENQCHIKPKEILPYLQYEDSPNNNMEFEEFVNFALRQTKYTLSFDDHTEEYFFEDYAYRRGKVDFDSLKNDLMMPILHDSMSTVKNTLNKRISEIYDQMKSKKIRKIQIQRSS